MIQQVNLYQTAKARPKTQLYFYLAGLLFIVLLLSGLSVYLSQNLSLTEQKVKQAAQLLSKEQARVTLLKAKVPKQALDATLIESLQQWQDSLAELKLAAQQLTDKNALQLSGFSAYLTALAQQSIPEVWLRKIYLDGQQESITLEGSSFQAELIPVFIQQLQNEPVFKGRSFAQLLMQKTDAPPEQIDFKLSTLLEPADKKKNARQTAK